MDKKYRNSISDTLENLIGTEGIKTDVSISVPVKAAAILFVTVLAAVTGAILLAAVVQKAVKK